jgi:glycosyltransferase 2 family protein
MTRKIAGWLQFALMLMVGLLMTWLAFRSQPLAGIIQGISAAHCGWVLVSILITMVGHASRARRWQMLIRASGHDASGAARYLAMMTGYLSNLGVPRLGEVSRCASLGRLSGVPILALGGTVVAERGVDLATLSLLLLMTLGVAGAEAVAFSSDHLLEPLGSIWGRKSWWMIVAVRIGVAAMGWLALSRRAKTWRGLVARIHVWAYEIWQGLMAAMNMRRMAVEFAAHTLVIWAVYYLQPLCTLLALGVSGDHIGSIAFYVFVFGTLARTIPLPAGSAGAYHYIVSQWLLFAGYPGIQAITVPTLNHAVQTLYTLVFGVLGLIGFFVLLRRTQAWAQDRGHSRSNSITPAE